MSVAGDRIRVLAERDPARLPWGELDVDVVLESTGRFTSKAAASAHLEGGAKKVDHLRPRRQGRGCDHRVRRQPSSPEARASGHLQRLVHHELPRTARQAAPRRDRGRARDHDHRARLHQRSEPERRLPLRSAARARGGGLDHPHRDRGRRAAVGLVLPELAGRLDGFALRVPTLNVSLVDLTFSARRDTSVEEIDQVMRAAASEGPLARILAYNDEPLVSVDFNHHPALLSIYEAPPHQGARRGGR